MKYFMQYLKTANVNLVKDMGMIPYKLNKLYNYDATVVTYKNGEYPYIDDEVKGVKLEFVNKIFNSFTLDGALYLLKNSSKIETLQIFHVTLSSFVYAIIYKMRNKNGNIYLKLDSSHKLVERIDSLGKIGRKFLKIYFEKADLISIEQTILYNEILKRAPYIKDKFVIIPNGVDYDYLKNIGIEYDYSKKKNIILNVARVGAEEKNTPMILEAFASIRNIESNDWQLHIVGEIEEKFKEYINEYFEKYPFLKEKVIFFGNIENRQELFHKYAEAKIFSLTSDFESFGIAFIEAAALGNVIISTDVGIASEIVANGNGALVKTGDVGRLTKNLEEYIDKESLQELSLKTYKICREKFDWNTIIEKLDKYLKNI